MRLPLPRPVCLLLYSCLILPFFSHIADMPGLACLNHLSTGVKSKACERVHAIAQQLLVCCEGKQRAFRRGRPRCRGAALAAAGGHQNVRGWQHSDKWRAFFFFFLLRCGSRRGRAPLWLREQRGVWRGIPRMSVASSPISIHSCFLLFLRKTI